MSLEKSQNATLSHIGFALQVQVRIKSDLALNGSSHFFSTPTGERGNAGTDFKGSKC